MKAFLAGIAVTLVVVTLLSIWHGVRNAEWLISAIKSPGEMALNDIQADMNAKRYEIAKEKIDVFLKTWQRFSSGPDSCSGAGISDVVVTFSKMPGGISATNVEPDGTANGSQPGHSISNLNVNPH
ncbi:MAG TPA: hypothetical protein VN836_12200 [Verrucomicrobiae bacterium]|nr:hypothetical protein [Verrucomicrobiae bacterium]